MGWQFLDTGAMYRAVTWVAIGRGLDLEDETALTLLSSVLSISLIPDETGDRLLVDGEDITDSLRRPEVERGVSLIAKVSGVRAALVSQQRAVAEADPTVVGGREIGTVVLPDARVKIYLSASVEVRAQRRYRELVDGGVPADYRQVVDELVRRDGIDSARADSPLRPAEDAYLIQTGELELLEVVGKIITFVESC